MKVFVTAALSLFAAMACATNFVERQPVSTDFDRFAVHPAAYFAHRLNTAGLTAELAKATPVVGVPIELAMPDGKAMKFIAYDSEVMAPELQQKWSDIRAFRAQSLDDLHTSARITTGPLGLLAIVFGANQVVVIEPVAFGSELYVSFDRAQTSRSQGARFACQYQNPNSMGHASNIRNPNETTQHADLFRALSPLRTSLQPSTVTGQTLRNYRLALAATGEYTAFFGGTVSGAAQGIVDATNRVNEVYQRDFSLRMVLVGNNNQLIYTNAATDPYSNDDGFAMLDENVTNLNTVIGSNNFDIGHVFSTGGGGVAGLGVVCGADKAAGVTGSGTPTGDPFWIDYVAHEMGHQWGGNHTFNGSTGACGGGNREPGAAYEPGSGSTIQAYAGICGAQDLQPNSDPWFHAKSLDEMQSYVHSQSCGTSSATNNVAPSVNAGVDHVIPARTPFLLTGTATDPEGAPLLYQWEQYDLGAQSPPDTDDGSRPIFRSFNASSSPTRLFPKLSAILNPATAAIGESLPITTRTLTFRLTVHDRANLGGLSIGSTNSDDVVLNVQDTGAGFAITSQNTPTSWPALSSQTITWNVAGTTAPLFNCANVNIALSLDGGISFQRTLAISTPNDGSETLSIPYTPTDTARVRVLCSTNGFFDINNAVIRILPEVFYSGFE